MSEASGPLRPESTVSTAAPALTGQTALRRTIVPSSEQGASLDGFFSGPSYRRLHERGARIHAAGEQGPAWRVRVGVVRLDRDGADGPEFGGLALVGDVIGAEVLLFGNYTFTARALSRVVLEPWSTEAEAASPRMLVDAMASSARRVADALALRSGTADSRVSRLLKQMGQGLAHRQRMVRVALPNLRDIAEITGLTVETVSRTISRLRTSGVLEMSGRCRSREVWISSDAE